MSQSSHVFRLSSSLFKGKFSLFSIILFILINSAHTVTAQSNSSKLGEDTVAVRMGKDLYKIGTVMIDKNKREIYLKGRVNMDKGLIEYLAVAEQGKTHESVLVLEIEPFHLQTALLLLGLEPGRNLEYQGDTTTPVGDPLQIFVEWKDAKGKKVKLRGEDLVYNLATKTPMPHLNWIFSGSKIIDGQFAAQIERSIIATYHDPLAIIDHPLPTGSDDELYGVNEKVVPKAGTEITMIIKAVRKK